MGAPLGSRETVAPEAGVREAAVRLTWKKRTETPAGGASVMVRDTGAVCPDGDGLEPPVCEFEPHPVRSEKIRAAAKGSKDLFRISGSLV
jgi:hypothetical protein